MNIHSSSTVGLTHRLKTADALQHMQLSTRFIMSQISQIAHTPKGPIEYIYQGNGEKTCVILHGGHSNCHEQLGLEEISQAGMKALIPSRPGYGKTPQRVGKSAAEAADAVIALLDELRIQTASVIAVSAGGPTGLYLASRYPERIDKLVLESAVTKRWLKPSDALYKTAKIIFGPRAQRATWAMMRLFLQITPNLIFRQMIPSFTKLKTKGVMASLPAQDKQKLKNMLMHASSGTGFMLDLEHKIPVEVLTKITIPTLIVHSQNDNSVPFEHAEHAHRLVQHAELFEAQTWGHLIWLGTGSAAVINQVSRFLNQGVLNTQ